MSSRQRPYLVCLAALLGACGSSDSDDLAGLSFSASRSAIDFGDVQIGDIRSESVSVTNTGVRPLTIFAEAGSNFSAEFRFSPPELSLDPGASAAFQVDFVPVSEGQQTSELTLRPGPTGLPNQTVSLEGQGIDESGAITLSETSFDFGLVVVASSESRGIFLTNNNPSQVRLEVDLTTNMGVCGEPSGRLSDFCLDAGGRLDPSQRLVLEGGERVELTLQYNPVVGGRSTGQLRLRLCENCSPILVELVGLGVQTGLSCDEEVDFGRVFPGTCRTREWTCRNVGNLDMRVTELGERPGRPLPIEYRGLRLSEQFLIESGTSRSFEIEFCPEDTTETSAVARLVAVDELGNETTALVDLTGVGGGPRTEVAPGRLDFGPTALIAPNRLRLTVGNTGFDDLELREVIADTATTGAFAVQQTSATIVPGESLDLEVIFEPQGVGPVQSGLRLVFGEVEAVEIPMTGSGVNLPPCNFAVETDLDFGFVPASEVREATTLIRNTGANDCLIYQIAPTPQTDPSFVLVGTTTTGEVLPAGTSRALQVQLRPSNSVGAVFGGIEVQASSPSQGQRTVPLSAERFDGGLTIAPNSMDFGVIAPSCQSQTRPVRLHNPAGGAVEISIVRMVNTNGGTAFTVQNATTPAGVSARSTYTFDVRFEPNGVGVYTGRVEIIGTVIGQPVTLQLPVLGSVRDPAVRRERFRQGYSTVDVLTVVNMTFRGSTFINFARNNWGTFADALVRNGVDCQVGVTSTDISIEDGRLLPLGAPVPRVITPQTFSADTEWAQRFRGAQSFGGDAVAGLEAARLALSFSRQNSANQGFRRDGTPLSVLIVNPDSDTSTGELQLFLDALAAQFFAGQQNDWHVSSIAVPSSVSPSCSGAFGFGFPNGRQEQATRDSGGTFVDWCGSDDTALLQALGQAAAGLRDRWRLSQPADPSTFTVRVNGTSIPETDMGVPQWSYDATRQELTFEPVADPRFGDEIEVEYQPACAP